MCCAVVVVQCGVVQCEHIVRIVRIVRIVQYVALTVSL